MRKPVHIVASPDGSAPPPGDGPVPVELQYVGVGDLHQRWFGDEAIVTDLAVALGPCIRERAVVRTTWDEAAKTGRIELLVEGRQLACRASGTDPVDLAPFTPVTRALAAYRDAVASRFDFRVASFAVGVEVLQRTTLCRLTVGGQFPPDGSTFAQCVDLGGDVQCVEAADGTTRFAFADPQHTAYLAGCFAP